jgi:hypothetical protein
LTWIQALSRFDQEQLKIGVAETVRRGITWPPNLPKFIELCENIEDFSESFYRFINHQESATEAEYITRNRVGFQCRTQLSEAKALKLWSETMTKVCKGLAAGTIKGVDLTAQRIESPEKAKQNLTPEQRNQQVDRKIDEMISEGRRLIGPFKARFEERSRT